MRTKKLKQKFTEAQEWIDKSRSIGLQEMFDGMSTEMWKDEKKEMVAEKEKKKNLLLEKDTTKDMVARTRRTIKGAARICQKSRWIASYFKTLYI
jgi:hypothetical protein